MCDIPFSRLLFYLPFSPLCCEEMCCKNDNALFSFAIPLHSFALHYYHHGEAETFVLPLIHFTLANEGFGASFDTYSWTQTVKNVTVLIPVPASTKGRNVDCRIEPKHLVVGLRGSSPVLDVASRVWSHA